jgi:hypothetical protein
MTQIPSLETLATLAATMASPAENPAATAHRALQLWQACGDELDRMAPHIQKRQGAIAAAAVATAENRAFLASFKPGETVPLDAFLKAVMPNSKPGDRLAKWRACTAANLAATGHTESAADVLRRDREEGIPTRGLTICRDILLRFLKKDRAATNRERGKKAADAKKPKKLLEAPLEPRKRPRVKKTRP